MTDFAEEWLGRIQPYFGEYGCWLVLVILFLKGVIFVGAVMPSAGVLVVAGGLVRQGQGSLFPLALAGLVGTAAGDTVSYILGQRLGHRLIQSKRWGKSIVSISERIRKEPALILFCHFENFLRMLVPVTAGISGVPFRKWLVLNTAGSVFWVAAYITMGYFLSLSGALAASKTIGLVVLGLLIVWFGARYISVRKARAGQGPVGQTRP